MRNRELTETRMMQVSGVFYKDSDYNGMLNGRNMFSCQALREELSAAERRAEEERAAHNAAKLVISLFLYVFSDLPQFTIFCASPLY